MASLDNIEDDFFGDCDDHDAFNGSLDEVMHARSLDQYGELSIRESVATERQYFAIGYHETYDECYEASLQKGFDDGYRNNYDVAFRLGHSLGKFAIGVETFKKSSLKSPHPTNDVTKKSIQESATPTENMLTEVSLRVRSLVLSITQASTSLEKNDSKGERLPFAYDRVRAEPARETSMKVLQQERLHEQKDLEDLAVDIENIMSVKETEITR